jgi:beta-glucanase (GH16 family)
MRLSSSTTRMRIVISKLPHDGGLLQSNREMLQYSKRAACSEDEKVARRSKSISFILAIAVPIALLCHANAQTAPKGAKSVATVADPGTHDPGAQLSGWVLKFAEEFDGTALNFSKWSPHPPGRLIMNGLQTWMPDAIQASGGQAHIVARKNGYTSGIITTVGTFAQTYGRFEIRFRIPAGRGLEPLFRLLPVPSGDIPSIDVMNAVGNDPTTALFANRWGDARADRDYTGSYKVADLSSGFHIVALEWDEEKLVWTVDGVERFQSFDGVPHQPMYLCLSLAVGTEKAGEPDAQTRFPATLDIDYVRVFARP